MKKGFTLIELLAVIVIIAIIGTIGIYSVTKILDKSRMNSLKDTAFAVRKAARLYVADHSNISLPKTLNMTPINGEIPAAEDAYLINLAKDPWGKDYKSVIAVIDKTENNKFVINVYLRLENKDWLLADDSSELQELVFGPINVINPLNPGIDQEMNYTYRLAPFYSLKSVKVAIIRNGSTAIANTDYLMPAISLTPVKGVYNIKITPKQGGHFSFKYSIQNAVDDSWSDWTVEHNFNPDIPLSMCDPSITQVINNTDTQPAGASLHIGVNNVAKIGCAKTAKVTYTLDNGGLGHPGYQSLEIFKKGLGDSTYTTFGIFSTFGYNVVDNYPLTTDAAINIIDIDTYLNISGDCEFGGVSNIKVEFFDPYNKPIVDSTILYTGGWDWDTC